jgi:hypothetical protein
MSANEIHMPALGWAMAGRPPARWRKRARRRWEEDAQFYAGMFNFMSELAAPVTDKEPE